jgi:pentatricopeptide repeat protein
MGSRWRSVVLMLRAPTKTGRDTVLRPVMALPESKASGLHGGSLLRGLAGSAAGLGSGGLGGRQPDGGGAHGQRRDAGGGPSDEVLVNELVRTRTSEAVGRLLHTAKPHGYGLMKLIQSLGRLGGESGPGAKRSLDWTMQWAKTQKGLLNERHYSNYVTQLGRQGRWRDAEAALEEMRAVELPPNVKTYSALVSAYATGGGEWQRAERAMEEMRAVGVQPDVWTFSALLSAYEKGGGEWQRAEATMEEMRAVGVQPDVVTYNALISVYAKGGGWQLAERALEEMRAMGVLPDVVTYNALVSAYAKGGGEWLRAERAMEEMRAVRVQPNVVTYSALISAYEKGGEWQRAERAMEERAKLDEPRGRASTR